MSSTPFNGSGSGSGSLNMSTVFNLSQARVMVVDDNQFSMRLITQMLLGFGIPTRDMCLSAAQAQDRLRGQKFDLLIVDCDMPEMDGYDLVHWLRRSGLEPNAFTPVLMISGHTRLSHVKKARDCGANFIVSRPMTPAILLDRILWLARDPRPFLRAGNYFGPDRRFKEAPLGADMAERRADMLRAQDDAAGIDNMTADGEAA